MYATGGVSILVLKYIKVREQKRLLMHVADFFPHIKCYVNINSKETRSRNKHEVESNLRKKPDPGCNQKDSSSSAFLIVISHREARALSHFKLVAIMRYPPCSYSLSSPIFS